MKGIISLIFLTAFLAVISGAVLLIQMGKWLAIVSAILIIIQFFGFSAVYLTAILFSATNKKGE